MGFWHDYGRDTVRGANPISWLDLKGESGLKGEWSKGRVVYLGVV